MLMHKGALALARAERQGIRIDLEYCENKKFHLTRKINKLTREVKDSDFFKKWKQVYGAKANIGSNQQLAEILYNVMKIPIDNRTVSKQGSTDENTLSNLGIPELKTIIQIRKLKKLRDTYLNAFTREAVNGYIHPFFNLHTVRTFRSSSDKPNFQNIPIRDKESGKTCRRALFPRPGHQFIEGDFSGLEVSIATCYHQDPVMIKYLHDKTSDMHLDMATQIFIFDHMEKSNLAHYRLRQASKNGFVFPQFYGDYFGNNAIKLCEWVKLPKTRWKAGMGMDLGDGTTIGDHLISKGIKSFNQFVDHLRDVEYDFWNNRFGVYEQWKNAWLENYKEVGYFSMFTGFTCSGIMRKNEVINYPVQGAASHCKLWSLIRLDEIAIEENWDSKIVGEIHDSILVDTHPDELEHVKETIHRVTEVELAEYWKWITVQLKVDIDVYDLDSPWLEKEKD